MSRPLPIRFVCDACGREVAAGAVCRCGSRGQRRVHPEDVFRRPATRDEPRWDPMKDWTAKYLQLAWNVEQLRRLAGPAGTPAPAEVRQIVRLTFASSSSLADWLMSGPEPASVTPGDVERLLGTEPLRIGAVVDGGTGPDSARIVPVGFARPPRFWVEYTDANRRTVRYDAVDLAERCLTAWQVFLTTRGVELPSWRS